MVLFSEFINSRNLFVLYIPFKDKFKDKKGPAKGKFFAGKIRASLALLILLSQLVHK